MWRRCSRRYASASNRVSGRRAWHLWMTLSGLAPYCVYSFANGLFDAQSVRGPGGGLGGVSYWFVAFPTAARLAVPVCRLRGRRGCSRRVFPAIYGQPWPKLQLGILGQLMWTRLAALAVLSIARLKVKGFGLLPNRAEWKTGSAPLPDVPAGRRAARMGARVRLLPLEAGTVVGNGRHRGGDLRGHAVGGGAARGVLLPRHAPAVAGPGIATSLLFGLGAPAVSRFSELAFRHSGRGRWRILRPGVPQRAGACAPPWSRTLW